MDSKHQGFKVIKCKKNGHYAHKIVFEPLFEAKSRPAERLIKNGKVQAAAPGTRVFSGFFH